MARIHVDRERLATFCRRHHIRRLALFGSALREEFGPDSDVDILVEFEPEHVPGLLGIARLERELSAIFGGRKVDLRTPEDLSRYFRAEVIEEAELQYAEGRRQPPQAQARCGPRGAGVVRGRVRSDLDMDRMLVLAVIKDIEIIGEAANQVSKALPLEAWLRPVDPEKAAQACRRLGLRVRVGQRRQPSPHRPEP